MLPAEGARAACASSAPPAAAQPEPQARHRSALAALRRRPVPPPSRRSAEHSLRPLPPPLLPAVTWRQPHPQTPVPAARLQLQRAGASRSCAGTRERTAQQQLRLHPALARPDRAMRRSARGQPVAAQPARPPRTGRRARAVGPTRERRRFAAVGHHLRGLGGPAWRSGRSTRAQWRRTPRGSACTGPSGAFRVGGQSVRKRRQRLDMNVAQDRCAKIGSHNVRDETVIRVRGTQKYPDSRHHCAIGEGKGMRKLLNSSCPEEDAVKYSRQSMSAAATVFE